ncbi:hypothetical protein COY87_00145 [Candidatus Roizmanbacteria bacterium CG_4_10_14_0_8_um_filter_33_9]|uniref:Uncharacterized protein n=1 Tax=Candidatus Roizmanbacteria bacterium CG_4_10_14_0_8_um_filter_33_9 TaxID=1974826 RepID=A0A2M7QKT5_9BACT|nr:MAG: hypothetical protein COY87_00145 [Candidatus Roizmanbacteria bacterium CG_4_10_14_0_8_um_filter_33_9]
MDLFMYIVISIVYVMVIHFAIQIRDWFDTFSMIGLFILGGIFGWYMKSYDAGIVFGVVTSLIFW